MTMVRKLTQAAAVAGVGFLMEAGGFVSGAQVQSPQAVQTIAIIMGVGTIGMLIFGIFVSSKFILNPRTHDILMKEIEHLRAGGKTPTSEESRKVVENLSGWSYDRLWGNNPVAGKMKS
jgi:oligogalacturonide transporter